MKTREEKLAVMAAWLDGKEILAHPYEAPLTHPPMSFRYGVTTAPTWNWATDDYWVNEQPKEKRVPLTPNDLPHDAVFTRKQWAPGEFVAILSVVIGGIRIASLVSPNCELAYTWAQLAKDEDAQHYSIRGYLPFWKEVEE